jgi:hypothetical protein
MPLVNVEVPKQHSPIDPTLLQIIGIIFFEKRIGKVVYTRILLLIVYSSMCGIENVEAWRELREQEIIGIGCCM